MNRSSLLSAFLLILFIGHGQSPQFGSGKSRWLTFQRDSLKAASKRFPSEDLVVLYDYITVDLRGIGAHKLQKNSVIKINTLNGIEKLKNIHLPESFDFYDNTRFERGKNKFSTPYIKEYKLITFDVRFITELSESPVAFDHHMERLKRVSGNGEYFQDQSYRFEMKDLEPGDVIEISYEASFEDSYLENIFYFNSDIAKVYCEYVVEYDIKPLYKMSEFTKAVNISDSLVKTVTELTRDKDYHQTKTVKLSNLQRINYPKNSLPGVQLPHLCVNLNLLGKVMDGTWTLFKPLHFEWVVFPDTTNDYRKAYIAQYAGVRKFTGLLPPFSDEPGKSVFLSALCDSFNSCRYLSANDLFYRESQLNTVFRGDHLLKKRIVQSHVFDLVKDVMQERKIFYFLVNIHDRRYSQHSTVYRVHQKYESNLFAIPVENSLVYLIPRYFGMKYYINELPFYYEDAVVALFGMNMTEETKNKEEKMFMMMHSPTTNFGVNNRTQTASVKVQRDSRKAQVSEKVILSGQFSTILRHLYLNDCIDSTISPYYFRKCTDKPGASDIKIQQIASSHVFPFKQAFAATQQVTLPENEVLSTRQWFSFPLSERLLTDVPAHDYYFDFRFSDTYNLMFEFDTPTTISNIKDFTHNISNDYFHLESDLVQNADQTYLMRVRLVVKQKMIPLQDMKLLTELLATLNEVNNFSLKLSKKA